MAISRLFLYNLRITFFRKKNTAFYQILAQSDNYVFMIICKEIVFGRNKKFNVIRMHGSSHFEVYYWWDTEYRSRKSNLNIFLSDRRIGSSDGFTNFCSTNLAFPLSCYFSKKDTLQHLKTRVNRIRRFAVLVFDLMSSIY